MQKRPKIYAVMVTYQHESRGLSDFMMCIENILPQVNQLIVVDNGSNRETVSSLRKLYNEDKIYLIENRENIGLADAQNRGIEYSLGSRATHILLLDDDSIPRINMVERLYQASEYYRNIALVAPILEEAHNNQPNKFVKRFFGVFFRRIYVDDKPKKVLAAIASGSMLSAEAIKKVGLMRSEFFIDYVDVEWCLRAQIKGWKIVAVPMAKMVHNIGNKTQHAGGVIASNHSARRRYTIYRNRLICWKKYWNKVPAYIVYDIMAAVYDLFRILLFEKQKFVKLKNAFKGISHGIREKYDG